MKYEIFYMKYPYFTMSKMLLWDFQRGEGLKEQKKNPVRI